MLNEYLSTVKETAWPESLPVDGEKCFLSISCGNSFLHWAFHGDGELAPALFWRYVWIVDVCSKPNKAFSMKFVATSLILII